MRLCIRLLLWVFPAILPAAARGQSTAEYLVVERVDLLAVLNRYQQQATVAERSVLAPLAPLRILRKEVLLSDGYSRAMQVSCGGAELFLVMDGTGGLLRGGQAGLLQVFPRTVPLNDTIEILQSATLTLTPLNAPPRTLSRGDRLVRFFRRNGDAYCATMGTSPRYGWFDGTPASEGRTWRSIRRSEGALPALTPAAEASIRDRLAAVNRALISLYAQFNAETGRREQPPQWTLHAHAGGLRCVLTGAPPDGRFRESTGYLARDMETILLGSGMQVIPGPGTIDVQVRRP